MNKARKPGRHATVACATSLLMRIDFASWSDVFNGRYMQTGGSARAFAQPGTSSISSKQVYLKKWFKM